MSTYRIERRMASKTVAKRKVISICGSTIQHFDFVVPASVSFATLDGHSQVTLINDFLVKVT